MDFGMPTLIECETIYENIQLCKKLGLDFIELNMNLPEYQIEELENVSKYQELAQEYAIYFTIHLDENLNIADFNHAVAESYMNTVKRSIAVAKKIKVPILNMHMNHGVHFTLPDRKVELFHKYFEEYQRKFKQFIAMCETEIGGSDIKICIENTNGFREYERKVIEDMLSSPVFALTWDIGHSHAVDNIDEKFIMKYENRLAHFHIHDAKDNKDHLILGTGEINLDQRIKTAKRNHCRCVVETKTVAALEESIKWLAEKRPYDQLPTPS